MANINAVGQAESESEDWNTLSEKTHFVLTPDQWDEFVKLLYDPPKDNSGVDRLMSAVLPGGQQ